MTLDTMKRKRLQVLQLNTCMKESKRQTTSVRILSWMNFISDGFFLYLQKGFLRSIVCVLHLYTITIYNYFFYLYVQGCFIHSQVDFFLNELREVTSHQLSFNFSLCLFISMSITFVTLHIRCSVIKRQYIFIRQLTI